MKGRPTKYSKEIEDEICDKISRGVTLSDICRQEHIPDRTVVYDWLKVNETFSQRFAHAREVGFDAIAEDTLDIADNASNDWMTRYVNENPELVLNSEHVQRSKLRIETRLKLLAKWNPKKYGDKIEVDAKIEHKNIPEWLKEKPDGSTV